MHVVAEWAAKAGSIIEEAVNTGLDGSHPLTIHAKMLRLELPSAKAELERLVRDCSACGQTVHWVVGLGSSSGHWAHRKPALHPDPVV